MVSLSSAEVFFQEVWAQYRTLAVHQNEYYRQGSQQVEGFRMQEMAADQLATSSIYPTDRSLNSLSAMDGRDRPLKN